MDDDLSQENRIRLIGRLFFFTCARRLILRSFDEQGVNAVNEVHEKCTESDERMLVELETLANTALTQWGGWGSNPRPTDYEFGVDDWE